MQKKKKRMLFQQQLVYLELNILPPQPSRVYVYASILDDSGTGKTQTDSNAFSSAAPLVRYNVALAIRNQTTIDIL